MAQITESHALSLIAVAARGQHPPLTAWEAYQLLWFWLIEHGNANAPKYRDTPSAGAQSK